MNDQARIALRYFHNRSLKYPGYTISFDTLLTKLFKTRVTQSLSALSAAITYSELSESDIKRIFESLADEGQGRIPKSANAFYDALRGEVTGVSWRDVQEIVVNSASDVATGVITGGQAVIDTAKSLSVVVPIAIVAGVLFVIYSYSKRAASV